MNNILKPIFVKTLNNHPIDSPRRWIGADPKNGITYGICVTVDLPEGSITSLRIKMRVRDGYSKSNSPLSATYYAKILSKEVNSYNKGTIAEEDKDFELKLENISYKDYGFIEGTIQDSNVLNKFSGKTIYIYLATPQEEDSYSAMQFLDFDWGSNNFSVTIEYENYTTIVSPSFISFSGTKVVSPTEEISISWSGMKDNILNPFTEYIFILRKDSITGKKLKTESLKDKNIQKIDIDLANFELTQGTKIYATIQAIGTIPGFNGEVKGVEVAVVNTLPDKPTIKVTGTKISENNTMTFTLNSQDLDNQELTYYYHIDQVNSSNRKKINGNTITLKSSDNLAYGKHTIYFCANDGLEDSLLTSFDFIVATKPKITKFELKYSEVNNGFGDSKITTRATIDYELEGNFSQPVFNFKVSQKSPEESNYVVNKKSNGKDALYNLANYGTINTLSNQIKINFTKIKNSIIKPGNQFRLMFTVFEKGNSNNKAEWTDWLTPGLRAEAPQAIVFNEIIAEKNKGTDDSNNIKWFNKNITFNFTNPSAALARPDIKKITIYCNYGSTTKAYSITAEANRAEGKRVVTKKTIDNVPTGTEVSFSIELVDAANQSVVTYYNTKFKRAGPIFFIKKDTFDIKQDIYKPYSQPTTAPLFISHSKAFSNGTKDADIEYEYKLEISTFSKTLKDYELEEKDGGATREIYFNSEALKKLILKLNINKNTSYTAYIVITAKDSFNNSTSLKQIITIDFREAPVFSKSEFKIYHDYIIGSSSDILDKINDGTIPQVPSYRKDEANNIMDKIMFNKKEKIVFAIPKVTDINEDLKRYEIYISRVKIKETDDLSNIPFDFEETPWVTLAYNVLEKKTTNKNINSYDLAEDENYYYYRHSVPSCSTNEQVYFKIRAIDSQRLYSEKISKTFIIYSRVAKPRFSIENLEVNYDSNTNSSADLKFNFNLIDLGGSKTTEGWVEDYYRKYNNFERDIYTATNNKITFTKKIVLKVEISDSINFINKVSTEISETGNDYLNFNPSAATLGSFTTESSRIYFRFTLRASYGKNGNSRVATYSDPIIKVWYLPTPTVAYRKNKIGINTNILENDEVLKISQFSEFNKIILSGENGDIIINLEEKTIEGLQVDCGSWTESQAKTIETIETVQLDTIEDVFEEV